MKITIKPLLNGWYRCEIRASEFSANSDHPTELDAYLHVMGYDKSGVIDLTDKKLAELRQKAQEHLSQFRL